MTRKRRIAVVSNDSLVTRSFFQTQHQHEEGLVHGGWTNDKNFSGELRVLKEIGEEDKYALVIVDLRDWRRAAIVGEAIFDAAKDLGIQLVVAVLDERRCTERQAKIILVPRKQAEIVALAKSLGIIE